METVDERSRVVKGPLLALGLYIHPFIPFYVKLFRLWVTDAWCHIGADTNDIYRSNSALLCLIEKFTDNSDLESIDS